MDRFITDENTGISYELVGDYYLPRFEAPARPAIGKYGRMRERYLKDHHRMAYEYMLLSGELAGHLEQVDKDANAMLETLIAQMVKAQGVTEKLKAENQMQWVGMMNNIKACAEEIIYHEIVFSHNDKEENEYAS